MCKTLIQEILWSRRHKLLAPTVYARFQGATACQRRIEGPRIRVFYPTKTCVELPEMHKNGLKIHTTLRRIA